MKSFKEFIEEDKGTYVCAKFDNATNMALKEYAKSLGLTPIKDFHVTIVYSEKTLNVDYGETFLDENIYADIVGIKYLGEPESEWRAIVLELSCEWLENKFNDYVEKYNYEHTYPEFIQHTSLAYKPPEGLKLDDIRLPDFSLIINKLVVQPML